MKYDILFLDIDGTLKQEPHGISEINKKAILLALKSGKVITLASGRNRDMLMYTIKELKLDKYNNLYTIALNGAHIFNNSTGRTLIKTPLPMDLTRSLFKNAYKLNMTCHVYTKNDVYFNYHDFQFRWYQDKGCICKLIDMKKDNLDMMEEPLKFYIFCKDKDKLRSYEYTMNEMTKGFLSAEYSSEYTLEYTSLNASKGLGVEYICQLLQLPPSTAIAAGDGENDISMLKIAGLGIAMYNALDTVKAQADTITQHTCLEDGVAQIIHTYLLK